MEIQEWYTRAEKELKGKSVDSLIRTYNGSLKVFPFLNEAEALNGVSFRASNLWFVQQSFFTNEPHAWNKLALQALMGGVNRLKLPTGWSTSQLIEALENIHVSFITFQINESDFDSYSEVLLQIASKQGGNENMLLHNKTINTLPLFE
ncbi:MAG: hypothetical protein ACKO8Q_05240, partial [Bacteroidota bacterium]